MALHPSDDRLILYYYGEGRRRRGLERHLSACAACRARCADLAGALSMVPSLAQPDRNERYGLEVWQRVRPCLPDAHALRWPWAAWRPVIAGAAMTALVAVAGFLAGRYVSGPMGARPAVRDVAFDADARARTAAIVEHLQQSERVLLDLINGSDEPADVDRDRQRAATLVESSRLYRDAALRAGELGVADVLDDLERGLLDVVHGPRTPTPTGLLAVRAQLHAAALLFKVRVLVDELQERDSAPVPPRDRT
jgi:hypothetical protein